MATQTTIAAALQDKIDAKAALKTIINNRFATNITNEKLSEYPAFLQSATSTWVRPADWLEIDSLVTAGEQKTVGLYAIYPNNNTLGMTNKVAFTVTGDHTIDWGDGSALENVNSNVQAEHTYNYDNISSETACSRGYRQVRITITPQSGQNITNLQFGKKHSTIVHGRIFSQWLDINISGTELTTFRFSEISYANLLEKIKVYQVTNKCTSCANMFQYCYSLQSLDLSATNVGAVTSAGNFAYGTTSLIKCRLPQAKWSFTVANNPLSATELNLLFGDLAAVKGQTITITGCTGASTCDKTIATNKGWTVTG